jgi:surface carbohydrate biosynthesis protein
VDGAGIVVGIGSTLLYESLARGKKTGIFSIRGTIIGDSSRNFGWPEEFADNGPFWTNHADESEFRRILGYLSSVSDADWENTRKEYVSNLMEYDPGNTRFVSLLQKLEVQLNSRYVSRIQK